MYLLGIVGATVWYSAEHYHPAPDTMEWRWRGLPHFFGVAVYALEVGGWVGWMWIGRLLGDGGTSGLTSRTNKTTHQRPYHTIQGINLTLPVSASMKSIKKPPMVMTIGVVGFAAIVAFYSAYAYASGVGAGCDIITGQSVSQVQAVGPRLACRCSNETTAKIEPFFPNQRMIPPAAANAQTASRGAPWSTSCGSRWPSR